MFTKLPNIFVDEHLAQLSSAAVACYLVVLRRTVGYHRHTDTISLAEFMDATGTSRGTVRAGLAELASRGLVTRSVVLEGASVSYRYGIADGCTVDSPDTGSDFVGGSKFDPGTEFVLGSESSTGEGQILTRGGSEFDPGVGQNLTPLPSESGVLTPEPEHLKKDIKKEGKKEKEIRADARTVRARTPRTPIDSRAQLMPLAVYRELTNRMPVGALWDEIIATVTDETQWRRSIMAVLARGWNPTNVDNLLAIYRAGGKIADRGKGSRASVLYAPTDPVPADEIAALEQLEAARGRGEDIPVESWEVDARLRRGYQRWHDERAGRDTHRAVD